jgi:hypothetical protein
MQQCYTSNSVLSKHHVYIFTICYILIFIIKIDMDKCILLWYLQGSVDGSFASRWKEEVQHFNLSLEIYITNFVNSLPVNLTCNLFIDCSNLSVHDLYVV